jgi:cell division transport system ATP-binding protein
MENAPLIEFKNASILQRDSLILGDVSFHVNAGEFVYLVGRTGSGKSSILKTVYGDLPLVMGEARVGKYDLKKIRNRQIPYLRRQIGIVFQDFQLLPDRNVHDNLFFVMKATGWSSRQKMEIRVREVLEKVNMTNQAFKMPHHLSGGEQQRVAIARALLNEPEVILADEPTGNLDPVTTQEILQLLHEICQNGRAILMATHDYSHMSKFAHKILKCEAGALTDVTGDKKEISYNF